MMVSCLRMKGSEVSIVAYVLMYCMKTFNCMANVTSSCADSGFVFETPLLGSDFVALREEWLTAGMTADVSKNSTSGLTGEISPNSKIAKSTGYIVLGPEPIIYPTSIALRLKSVATSASKANTLILRIKTDGIQPFHLAP